MDTGFIDISLKMIGSLILVLGIIICLFYLVKRYRLNYHSYKDYPVIRLIGTLNIAPKRSIALVEVLDQWLVLGVGTESVNLLSKVDRPVSAETKEPQEINKGQNPFVHIYNKMIAKKND